MIPLVDIIVTFVPAQIVNLAYFTAVSDLRCDCCRIYSSCVCGIYLHTPLFIYCIFCVSCCSAHQISFGYLIFLGKTCWFCLINHLGAFILTQKVNFADVTAVSDLFYGYLCFCFIIFFCVRHLCFCSLFLIMGILWSYFFSYHFYCCDGLITFIVL